MGRRRRPRLRPLIVAIGGAIVLPLAVTAGITWTALNTQLFVTPPVSADVVTTADLAEEYGIRFNLVAVSAAGGMIDVRFTITDSEKAELVLHHADTLPMLYVPSTGAVIRAPQPHAHKLVFLDGASYFLLYPNSGGAIQPGAPVSVVIDAIRTEPMIAQS